MHGQGIRQRRHHQTATYALNNAEARELKHYHRQQSHGQSPWLFALPPRPHNKSVIRCLICRSQGICAKVPFTNYVYTLQCKRSFMSYLVAGQHFPGREAASALEGRCHRSPGQATPKAERRPGSSAICARVPRPLWPQSAKLTGAKEAMERCVFPLLYLSALHGVFLDRPYRAPIG